jgi:hypothetical protein
VPVNGSSVLRSKADARDNYNRLNRWYDLLAGRNEEKYRQTGIRPLNLEPGEKVLEIGLELVIARRLFPTQSLPMAWFVVLIFLMG